MDRKYKCYLSASYDADLSLIKSVLAENNIETFDLYDFSIGSSIQEILKRKLRQADFAVFVVSKDSKSVLYEIGVCEGIGKPSLIIIDREASLPFYIENKLSLTANLNDKAFLKMTLLGFIDEIKAKRKPIKKNEKSADKSSETYSSDTKGVLNSLLEQTKSIREVGHGKELEYVIEEIFKTINLKYADNSKGPDIGIDFALWSNKLGRIIGNPIIVEAKFGELSDDIFKKAEYQIKKFAESSDAKAALLLYLDKTGKRYKVQSSLDPLIIAYDTEDFIKDLLASTFENVILTSRNKIAHGH
ncbi:toll/interleukin-1 receptor domain-containing protein [Aquiflexum sp. XJ19-10]|nr:toll/interleukin-1 receptor domain-containing protein [Aquiflexum gelatinilyticum]